MIEEFQRDIKECWWRLDEKHNALDYLDMGVRSLMEVERTPWAWKWVCIALHGALYGFAVCAVKGTDSRSVTYIDKKTKETMLQGFNIVIKKMSRGSFYETKYFLKDSHPQ